jgi:nucleoside 2-deoxyribosyltransferase
MKPQMYLSGPMTGIPGHNFQNFRRALDLLKESGYAVVSPHSIDYGETDENRGGHAYEVYMRGALTLLMECDSIVLMTGWERSRGCLTELNVASALNMRVFFFNTATGALSTNAECNHDH